MSVARRLPVKFTASLLGVALLGVALLLATAPASAQTTQADADALRTAIHGFFDRMIGVPTVADALTLKITPAGDHLALEIGWPEIGPISGYKLTAGVVTANAKALSGGRWAIDDIKLPAKIVGTGERTAEGGGKSIPIGFAMTIGAQASSMVFDPALATTSTADSKLRDYDMTVETAQGTQTSHIDTLQGHSIWQPTSAGRIDMQSGSTLNNYTSTTPTPGGSPVNVSFDNIAFKAQVKNFAIGALGALLQDVIALGRAQTGPDAKPGAPQDNPENKAMARRALTVLGDSLDSMQADYVFSGLKIEAMGANGGAQKISFGLHFGSEDGGLLASMPIQIEGIVTPDIVKGPIAEVMPRQIGLTPTISGISKAGITSLLQQGIDGTISGNAAWQAAAMKLLADNPVTVGFENLAVDFGVAHLEGDGELEVGSPTDLSGKAEFHATGLDALIKRATASPELKQAAPVLIFLKGMGEQDGKEMVWKVGYEDGHLTVNGTDLSDLAPSRSNTKK